MAIRTTAAIREVLGGLLEQQGFILQGKWPLWSLERSMDGRTEKIELFTESVQGEAGRRRLNINFAVQHPQTGQDIWMNRPYEEWFEYCSEEQLRRELSLHLSRIVEEVLPWMQRMRSE